MRCVCRRAADRRRSPQTRRIHARLAALSSILCAPVENKSRAPGGAGYPLQRSGERARNRRRSRLNAHADQHHAHGRTFYARGRRAADLRRWRRGSGGAAAAVTRLLICGPAEAAAATGGVTLLSRPCRRQTPTCPPDALADNYGRLGD